MHCDLKWRDRFTNANIRLIHNKRDERQRNRQHRRLEIQIAGCAEISTAFRLSPSAFWGGSRAVSQTRSTSRLETVSSTSRLWRYPTNSVPVFAFPTVSNGHASPVDRPQTGTAPSGLVVQNAKETTTAKLTTTRTLIFLCPILSVSASFSLFTLLPSASPSPPSLSLSLSLCDCTLRFVNHGLVAQIDRLPQLHGLPLPQDGTLSCCLCRH